MQFSVRRMLLAVAVAAATLGMLVLYAKRCGMFDSTDALAWWAVAIVTAFGVGGLVLVLHRRDFGRIVAAIVWVILGWVVGSMLSPDYPPRFAILGGVVGGIGFILVSWLDSPPTSPGKTHQ